MPWIRSWRSAALVGVVALAGCDSAAAPDEPDVAAGSSTDGDSGGEETTAAPNGDSSGESDGGAAPDCSDDTVACGDACVDLQSDPNNCGACGVACVIPEGVGACTDGICGLGTCDEGFADCDGAIGNGCETVADCQVGGACATSCGSTGGLSCDDPCAPACVAPTEVCNFADDNCDGTCDEGGIEGCRVPVHLGYDAQWGQVLMTDLDQAQQYGIAVEQENYFYLYAMPGSGAQPLQRCINAGEFGYSEENGCGDYGGYESTLGFFAVEPLCDGIALIRLRRMSTMSTRMTIDMAEAQALATEGWEIDPTFTGYAWTTP